MVVLLLLAARSDIKTYKVRNCITYPFILTGPIINFALEGTDGFIFSLWGMILPLICLIPLYMLRMLGAGDIKLFSAVGSIMGAKFAINSMLYSFAAGGIAAAAIILWRGCFKDRLKYLANYIKGCYLTMSFIPYSNFEDRHDNGKFHFAVAVAVGSFAAVFADAGTYGLF